MTGGRAHDPDFDRFCRLAEKGNLVPVYREILADLDTPVSAFLKIDRGADSFLLESVEGGEKWGRYSFLGTDPALVIESRGPQVEIRHRDGRVERRRTSDPLEVAREILRGCRAVALPELPRFAGGLVGYLSYDLVRFFERLPARAPDVLGEPELYLVLADSLVVFDNVSGTVKAVVHARVDPGCDLRRAWEEACARVDALIERLRGPLPARPPVALGEGAASATLESNFPAAGFEQAVERAKEYVYAGDVIQVVLSQRFTGPLRARPLDVYRCLRALNPSPYMFFLRAGPRTVLGASPEVMARLEGRELTVRPIAGTRPRGSSEREDRELERELLSDAKEIAEHVMLLDLGRNDVGRVSRTGTVEVTERMVVERYSHVMHIVSNVRGELAPGLDCFDAFRATFPAGTLTGAPKIRAMEIIDELEPSRRGIYGGAVGYFDFSGNMDTCIAIRTMVVEGDRIHVQAGAGIVADSDPARENAECYNKARALFQAVRRAERMD